MVGDVGMKCFLFRSPLSPSSDLHYLLRIRLIPFCGERTGLNLRFTLPSFFRTQALHNRLFAAACGFLASILLSGVGPD